MVSLSNHEGGNIHLATTLVLRQAQDEVYCQGGTCLEVAGGNPRSLAKPFRLNAEFTFPLAGLRA